MKRSNIRRLACVSFLFVGGAEALEWHSTHAHIILVVWTRAGMAHDALVHGLGLNPKGIDHAHLHLHLEHGWSHGRSHAWRHGAIHGIRICHREHGLLRRR